MSDKDPTILQAVAAELKARLDDAKNEPVPSKITSALFSVHRSATAASKLRDGDDPL